MWAVTQPGLVLSQLLQQAVHRSCLYAGSRVWKGVPIMVLSAFIVRAVSMDFKDLCCMQPRKRYKHAFCESYYQERAI